MTDQPKNDRLFQVLCPCCGASIWVDARTGTVIKSEKPVKKKGSLDDLLLMEKKKVAEMDHKLEATFELQKKKLKQAEEKFDSALAQSGDKD